MLTGVHFLLTYACTHECDHCFLYCSPRAEGTFTIAQLQRTFDEIAKIGTVDGVYFEGGEPFLYFPLMLEGIRRASSMGLDSGIVTNSYWAHSEDDARLWLAPLKELRITNLSVSDDDFHGQSTVESNAQKAARAAKAMDIPTGTICIEGATVEHGDEDGDHKGEPVVGGGVKFRGRAVEKLAEGLPTRRWDEFTSCPHEELAEPKRVHVDAFGHVHLCQGLSMGNMWKTPLSRLVADYRPDMHPICRSLIDGGPALLGKKYGILNDHRFIDACHCCFYVRRALIDRFPEFLAPHQVYGLESEPEINV